MGRYEACMFKHCNIVWEYRHSMLSSLLTAIENVHCIMGPVMYKVVHSYCCHARVM